MLAKAILVHGVIGYKFCWLLPFEDQNQGTLAGHESNDTVVGDHWEDMNQLIHQLGTNHSPSSVPMTLCIQLSSQQDQSMMAYTRLSTST